ncbi:LysR family transcriptional regulator [Rhodoplanes sp. TEM]|uniref:LysR family transcriptional regulator n=1 Tax=Rhodoplanes tepidamans TaxID=200616 RepID=A0ABT5JDX2_RHOTP|nr:MULTISPECIES: LysR family transcriptional regulator [Rhodoplanes]MDC7787870.1 LysR family transcriptional regulator [Rhodoplanes tepidamans]MDC7985671.1 LysR family transcriptional regulator [Rhodoplanes sp. TEM]MDQ0357867.1 DNA-binding transcriptional LysR family regulator [Rhodoplanes tepidamans]
MTVTLKQIEALHWIARLGTFERAAARLNTTQSAVSKRIQELEAATGLALFDRTRRGARLTEQGEQVLALGREMMTLEGRILDLRSGSEPPTRRLRIGVTELSALTWLPRFVAILRRSHPAVTIEPDVDLTRNLHERLLEGALDLVVAPELTPDPEVVAVPLADVENAWMSRPGLVTARRPIPLEALVRHPIVTQGNRAGSGVLYARWFKAQGIVLERTMSTDSMMAAVGLTVAGLGVGYLPRRCFRPLVQEGKLVVVPTRPALPPVPYAALYRSDGPTAFLAGVVAIARKVCDFSRQLQR